MTGPSSGSYTLNAHLDHQGALKILMLGPSAEILIPWVHFKGCLVDAYLQQG